MSKNLQVNPRPASTSGWSSNNGSIYAVSYANNEITITLNQINGSTLTSMYNMGGLGTGQFVTTQGLNYQREVEVWSDVPAKTSPGTTGFNSLVHIPANQWTRVVEQFTGYAQSQGWPKYLMNLVVVTEDGSTPSLGPHIKLRRAGVFENPSGVTIPYGDGSRSGWHWSGTPDASYSWGQTHPSNLLNGIPGGYANGKLIERLYLGAQQLNDWRRGIRRNGIPNPRMNPGASSPFAPLYSFSNYGTGGTGTRSGVSGVPNQPEGFDTTMRQQWSTASTQGGYGGWSFDPNLTGFGSIHGTWVRAGAWVRASAAHTYNLRLALSRVGQPQLYVSSPNYSYAANTWFWLSIPKYWVAPDYPITTALLFAYIPTEAITVGEWLDVTGGILETFPTEPEIDAAPPLWAFSGNSPDNLPYDDYSWVGAVDASQSNDIYYARVGG